MRRIASCRSIRMFMERHWAPLIQSLGYSEWFNRSIERVFTLSKSQSASSTGIRRIHPDARPRLEIHDPNGLNNVQVVTVKLRSTPDGK